MVYTARRRRLLRLRLADRRHDHPRHLGCTGLRGHRRRSCRRPARRRRHPRCRHPIYVWRCSSALCLHDRLHPRDAAVLALAHALECAPSRLATAGGAGAVASPPDPSFRLRPHMTADLSPMPPPNLCHRHITLAATALAAAAYPLRCQTILHSRPILCCRPSHAATSCSLACAPWALCKDPTFHRQRPTIRSAATSSSMVPRRRAN